MLQKIAWGVDDYTLFKYAVEQIANIKQQPWLVSILSVGTHPPYLVPNIKRPNRNMALKYTDQALEYLLSQPILDDTLVVITTDETLIISICSGF